MAFFFGGGFLISFPLFLSLLELLLTLPTVAAIIILLY